VPKLPRDFQVFLTAVNFSAALLIWLNPQALPPQVWPELLLFLVLVSLASMFPIPDPRGGYITAASVLFYVLIMVHGPWPSLFVAASAYAVGAAVSRTWLPWRTVFNGAQMGISVWLAGIAFYFAGGSIQQLEIRTAIVPLALAILTHQVANNFFVSSYFSRLRRTPLLTAWISDIRSLILSNMLSIPIAVLLGYVYVTVHPLTLLLYLFSLPFQRRAHQLQIRQKQIFDQAIDSLVLAIDTGFPQGAGHSRLVANTSTAIGRHLGLTDTQVDNVELGALLHDVGLLGLDEFLGKQGLRTDEVAEKLKEHVAIGAEISRELPQREIAEIVLYHHEHFDGSGYPKGLKGRQIPIGARIVALAEAFESMRAGGFPYGQPISTSEAKDYLIAEAGTKFDPVVVEAFVSVLGAGAILDHEATQVSSAQTLPREGGPA
jgi:HD-GYP domain-containing protein (c-di-GMP phosphodiesterase class II)